MLSAGEYDNKQSKKVPKTEENVKSLKKSITLEVWSW